MKTSLIVIAAAILGATLVAAMTSTYESPPAAPADSAAHWRNATKIIARDSHSDDLFGFSVAIDGDLTLIGAPQNDDNAKYASGAAYLFQHGRKPVTLGRDIAEVNGEFGYSVALRGRTAFIGKPGDSFAGACAGAVYLYESDERGEWERTGRLVADDAADDGQFGRAVALDDDTALIGSANSRETGAVYVFREEQPGIWRQQHKFSPSTESPGDRFGSDIAVCGQLALIGACGSNEYAGAAYVFERDDAGNWTKVASLMPSDITTGCLFGAAVALWDRTIVVGAPGNRSVYVFRETEHKAWRQVARLASDVATGTYRFGSCVSISEDSIAVESLFEKANDGAVYLYRVNEDGNWRQTSKIALPAQTRPSLFGDALAISGDELVVGAPNSSGTRIKSGAAYRFKLNERQR